MFYNKLPDDIFDITTTLVENLNNEVKEKGSIHHLPNHFNKCTYYYPLIDQILPLEAKHGLDALKNVYNTILSKSPDIYMEVTRSKEDHPSFWRNSYYIEIGYSIYKEIWDENSKKTITPGQQHAPTENTMGIKSGKIAPSLVFYGLSFGILPSMEFEAAMVIR